MKILRRINTVDSGDAAAGSQFHYIKFTEQCYISFLLSLLSLNINTVVRATSHSIHNTIYDPTHVHLCVGLRKANAAPFAKSFPFHFQQFPLFCLEILTGGGYTHYTEHVLIFISCLAAFQLCKPLNGMPVCAAIQCQHIVNFIMCCEWVCVFVFVRSAILYDVPAESTCKLYAWPIST